MNDIVMKDMQSIAMTYDMHIYQNIDKDAFFLALRYYKETIFKELVKHDEGWFECFPSIASRDDFIKTSEMCRVTTIDPIRTGILSDVRSRMKEILITGDDTVKVEVEHTTHHEHYNSLELMKYIRGVFYPRMFGLRDTEFSEKCYGAVMFGLDFIPS